MHRNPVPPKAQEFLDTFKDGKGLTNEAFIAGIRQFTTFANLDPESRHQEFGNRYIGLHYDTDLGSIWNAEHTEKVKSFEFNTLTPLVGIILTSRGIRRAYIKEINQLKL